MAARSETIANIAAAIMCLVVAYAVADRYILEPSIEPPGGYRPGDVLTATPDQVGLVARSGLSALVVVSNSCRFCSESAPFYRELTALEKTYPADKFRTVFLGMTGAADAEAFVAAHRLDARSIRATRPICGRGFPVHQQFCS
jgi:hypothetical protein